MPIPKKIQDPLDNPALNGTLSDSLRTLARRGETRSYRKGTLLIQEGDLGDTLYVILSGRLRAFAADTAGREITYGVYGPGATLGEMSLDGGPRSASVAALEATQCAVITRHTLREHIAADPEFAFELLSKVIWRARIATASARSMALLDSYGRLAQLLESLAAMQADGTRVIEERLTHAELAHRIGCSREMVSRLMKDLERGQFCQRVGPCLVLKRQLPARW